MARIYLIGGEKGGVGKSFVARTLIQYFIDKRIPFAGVESDIGTPDVATIYKEYCKVARFSEDELKNDPFKIYDLALEKPVVVNLPANIINPLKAWLVEKEMVQLGKDDGVFFCHWLVTNGKFDSLQPCLNVIAQLGGFIPHVLIKNHGTGREWDLMNENPNLLKVTQEYKVPIIDFPDLDPKVVNKLLAERLTYSQYQEPERSPSSMRVVVRSFLRKAYEAFESTGLLDSAQPPKLEFNKSKSDDQQHKQRKQRA